MRVVPDDAPFAYQPVLLGVGGWEAFIVARYMTWGLALAGSLLGLFLTAALGLAPLLVAEAALGGLGLGLAASRVVGPNVPLAAAAPYAAAALGRTRPVQRPTPETWHLACRLEDA